MLYEGPTFLMFMLSHLNRFIASWILIIVLIGTFPMRIAFAELGSDMDIDLPALEEIRKEHQVYKEGRSSDVKLDSDLTKKLFDAFKKASSLNILSRRYPDPSIYDDELKYQLKKWLPGNPPSTNALGTMMVEFCMFEDDEGGLVFNLALLPSIAEFRDDSYWIAYLEKSLSEWNVGKYDRYRPGKYMLTAHYISDLFHRYPEGGKKIPSIDELNRLRKAIRSIYQRKLAAAEFTAYPRILFLKLSGALGDPVAFESAESITSEVLGNTKDIKSSDVFEALRALRLLGATKVSDLDKDGSLRRKANTLLHAVLSHSPDKITEDIVTRDVSYDSFR